MKLSSLALLTLGLGLTAVACEPPSDSMSAPSDTAGTAGASVTVTTMKQGPDGEWTTTSQVIPAPPAPRIVGDGVEATQSALHTAPCSHGSSIVLWSNPGFTGNILCLEPDSSFTKISLGGFPANSGYSITPLYLYNAGGTYSFTNCNSSYRSSSSFSGTAVTGQQASQNFGICHF
jgi:hypothetical protein